MVRRPWKQTDNSNPSIKCALRFWLAHQFLNPHVLECYGGHGIMFEQCWSKLAVRCETTSGNALEWLRQLSSFDFDIYDVDPYASPWEAIQIVGEKTRGIAKRLGIVATDGSLRRRAFFRGGTALMKLMSWDPKDRALMGGIYWRYPDFCKWLIQCFFQKPVESFAVRYGKGFGNSKTAYFAAVVGGSPCDPGESR